MKYSAAGLRDSGRSIGWVGGRLVGGWVGTGGGMSRQTKRSRSVTEEAIVAQTFPSQIFLNILFKNKNKIYLQT